MSKHLDLQTGPSNTVGNQRSQFYRREKESRRTTFNGHCSVLSYPNLGCPRSSPLVEMVKPNLAWFRSRSGSLQCHKRQHFITSPLLASCIFSPLNVSYSAPKVLPFIRLLRRFFQFDSFFRYNLSIFVFLALCSRNLGGGRIETSSELQRKQLKAQTVFI